MSLNEDEEIARFLSGGQHDWISDFELPEQVVELNELTPESEVLLESMLRRLLREGLVVVGELTPTGSRFIPFPGDPKEMTDMIVDIYRQEDWRGMWKFWYEVTPKGVEFYRRYLASHPEWEPYEDDVMD